MLNHCLTTWFMGYLKIKMISELINNILAANDEHRGTCQSSRIRVELNQVIDFLNTNDIPFIDEQDILEMLHCELNLKGDWKVFLTSDETIELIEIPDNWVRVYINADGTIYKAHYI